MRVLFDFVWIFSTATSAELRIEDVLDCLSCILECNCRKCRHTILLIVGLGPLMSSTTHLSKAISL